jgi:hypothetical protein
MRSYIGRRAPDTVPGREHQDSSPYVVASDDGVERPLPMAEAPADYVLDLSTGFDWGYGGSGPINLAGAILYDALGFTPSPSVVLEFCESVVAELPRSEFTLHIETFHAWLDERLASGCAEARSAAGPQHL